MFVIFPSLLILEDPDTCYVSNYEGFRAVPTRYLWGVTNLVVSRLRVWEAWLGTMYCGEGFLLKLGGKRLPDEYILLDPIAWKYRFSQKVAMLNWITWIVGIFRPRIPFSKRLNARRYPIIQIVRGFLARLLSLLENKGFVVSGFSAYELFLLSSKFRIVRKSRLYPIIKKSEREKKWNGKWK